MFDYGARKQGHSFKFFRGVESRSRIGLYGCYKRKLFVTTKIYRYGNDTDELDPWQSKIIIFI